MNWTNFGILILGIAFTAHGSLIIFSKTYYQKLKRGIWKGDDGKGSRVRHLITAINILLGGVFLLVLFLFLSTK